MPTINAKTPFKTRRASRRADVRIKDDTVMARTLLQTLIDRQSSASVETIGYDPASETGSLEFRIAGSAFFVTIRVCPECSQGTCEKHKEPAAPESKRVSAGA
jgi:hypothetical protein